jgi:AcrR family transcriptional regulator
MRAVTKPGSETGKPPADPARSVRAVATASSDSPGGDGRVSRARRLREERSAQILSVARRLFAEQGYHGTKLQDILDSAGIARGTFYLHFDGKRAIFDQLVDGFLDRIRNVVTPVDLGPQAPPPLQQIEDNLLRVTAVLSEHRELTRIVLLSAEGLDAEADAKMADFYGQLHQLLATAFERGQLMRLVRPCDARVVAHAALGSLKEVALQWIVRIDGRDPGPHPDRPDDRPKDRHNDRQDDRPDGRYESHRGDDDREKLAHVCREVLAYGLYGLFRTDP